MPPVRIVSLRDFLGCVSDSLSPPQCLTRKLDTELSSSERWCSAGALASLVARTDADRDYDRGWIASQTMAEKIIHALLELVLLPYWLPIYIQRSIASTLHSLAAASQQNIDELLKLHATQALVSMTLQSVSLQEQDNLRTSRVRLIGDVLQPALNALYLLLCDVPPTITLVGS